MNTGTAIKDATVACSWVTSLAAKTTKLPVICDVNRASSPRKPMTSTLPAITHSTNGSSFTGYESSTEGSDTAASGRSVCRDSMSYPCPVGAIAEPFCVGKAA
jgi:hypothetical protein